MRWCNEYECFCPNTLCERHGTVAGILQLLRSNQRRRVSASSPPALVHRRRQVTQRLLPRLVFLWPHRAKRPPRGEVRHERVVGQPMLEALKSGPRDHGAVVRAVFRRREDGLHPCNGHPRRRKKALAAARRPCALRVTYQYRRQARSTAVACTGWLRHRHIPPMQTQHGR